MITVIGIVAGKILTLFEEINRPLTSEEIEFYLDEPTEIILMSIGWLARQGLIRLEKDEYDEYVVSMFQDPLQKDAAQYVRGRRMSASRPFLKDS